MWLVCFKIFSKKRLNMKNKLYSKPDKVFLVIKVFERRGELEENRLHRRRKDEKSLLRELFMVLLNSTI